MFSQQVSRLLQVAYLLKLLRRGVCIHPTTCRPLRVLVAALVERTGASNRRLSRQLSSAVYEGIS